MNALRYFFLHLALALPASCFAADARWWTLELQLGEQRVEGMPLFSSDRQIELVARDGRLWSFAPSQAKNFRKASSAFTSYSPAELSDRLRREMGRQFEVTGTGHYLIVHPAGQRDYWAARFEDLYRSFRHYFSVRGFTLEEPRFPLVAVVWKSQQDFLRYAQSDGSNVGPGTLGYYSPVSNRVTLFDVGGGSASAANWSANADTIIHEATHQTAFNTGLHQRFGEAPRWLVEGLATMFEAPGVWNSRQFMRREDRINRGRFNEFKSYLARRPVGNVANLVGSDRLFKTDVSGAYAEAWALSFYLVETQAGRYSQYLKLTASRPAFQDYTSPQRLADFSSIFGGNLPLLEKQFLKFIEEQK